MKVKVDLNLCQSHGQCVIAAAEIFQFDDAQKLTWVESPDESLRDAAEEAADVCPCQAITIED